MFATHDQVTAAADIAPSECPENAATESVYVENGGAVHRVSRAEDTEDTRTRYDADRVRAGLGAMTGIISAEEAEWLKDLVYYRLAQNLALAHPA